jgi:hypothetical protein
MIDTTKQSRTLSKSDFKLARNCEAKLYFRENRYPDSQQSDPYMHLLAWGGYMVEALAQAMRPDGIQVEPTRDPATAFERTLELLKRDPVTIFQATLLFGRRLARVDILEKDGNTIRLIEVKSSSIDSDEHSASFASGKFGCFRNKTKPYAVNSNSRDKIEDIVFQTLVARQVFPLATIKPYLLLVDKCKRSTIDNLPNLFEVVREQNRDGTERTNRAQYIGTSEQLAALDLLAEIDVSAEVEMVRDEIESEATRFEAILDAEWDSSFGIRGAKCKDCEFHLDDDDLPSGYAHCWGPLAYVKPHMLELVDIGRLKDSNGDPLVESLFAAGKASLFDIPEDRLVKKDGSVGTQAEKQIRQIEYTRRNATWLGPNLRRKVEGLTCPVHYIDFEVSRLALPYHAGMRPWGQVAFQWSCHTVDSPGAAPTHHEWLNTSDLWPNASFVRALRETIGDSATVLTWSGYEGITLKGIDEELKQFGTDDPELAAWIANVINNRIVDLHEWARNDFYHPGMRGRTSIKVVLDALWKTDPMMRHQFTAWTGVAATESDDPYHELPPLEINGIIQDVREGTGAIRAYEAMMYGVEKHDVAAKTAWSRLLREYCKLDTLSMILVFEHWRRVTAA